MPSHSATFAGIDFVAGEKPDGSEQNTRGQWSYGYRSVLESTQLTLVSNHFNSTNDTNGFHDELEGYYDVVAIYANTGSTDVITNFNGHGNNFALTPNQMALHPGANNELAVVRWTSPTTDTFNILANWIDLDPHGGNGVGTHLLINGVKQSAFDLYLSSGTGSNRNGQFALNAGDMVDFVVDAGNHYLFDTTGFDAEISIASTVPEPHLSIYLLIGLLLWLALNIKDYKFKP